MVATTRGALTCGKGAKAKEGNAATFGKFTLDDLLKEMDTRLSGYDEKAGFCVSPGENELSRA